ncbi:hypothetical protein [Kitasatospora aureofaciens]|uniref:hypothetical protein n=1 Tax=Kitasatospora aureofaciens TaxID=1894 RepID=UPI0036F482C3
MKVLTGHRRAAHERHVGPLRARCDLVVDGALAPEALAGQVWAAAAARDGRGRVS